MQIIYFHWSDYTWHFRKLIHLFTTFLPPLTILPIHNMTSYIPNKKPRAIAASIRFFPTLHFLSLPTYNHHCHNHNNNTTTTRHDDEWPRYRAFLLSSIIHLQHASSIFDLPQLNALLEFISIQPDFCRKCITFSNIPSPPTFANETNFLNTSILSNQQQQLFLTYPPHLFVQHNYS